MFFIDINPQKVEFGDEIPGEPEECLEGFKSLGKFYSNPQVLSGGDRPRFYPSNPRVSTP
jgi:hypothetical protein